jgi:nitroimidazol reductase NimA-like FMN-containing flavoprotein (pyridoxamine 5'-phosphate oxidase superfamily)
MTSLDPGAVARAILDGNRYMTLATADAAGRPWASPVYFDHDSYTSFFWISSPDAQHSLNISVRPEASLVVFDSTVVPGTGEAVYVAATASQLSSADIERGLQVYPKQEGPGVRSLGVDDVSGSSPYRLYRADASEQWILCPREAGTACSPHGLAYDHRLSVGSIAPE